MKLSKHYNFTATEQSEMIAGAKGIFSIFLVEDKYKKIANFDTNTNNIYFTVVGFEIGLSALTELNNFCKSLVSKKQAS